MTLWRLELARLMRTHRWMILAGVFGVFAVSGPLLAAYVEEILARFAGEVVVELPEQRPVDGLAGFIDNVTSIGLLAVVIVAAAALAMDSRPEAAAFLRTRVTRARSLLLPRYAVVAAAAAVSLVCGTAVAWLLTGSLLGPLPVGPMLLGTAYGVLYLGFVVAVVAAVAGYTRGVVGTIFVSVAVLLVLALLGIVEPVRPWLPGELVAAVLRLVDGAGYSEFARAAVVTIVATPALLALAVHRFARREL
jgi:ABC-2 type transport system permease protein